MFTELKRQKEEMSAYHKATRVGASAMAKFFAYTVAISAIVVLSLIFGQTTSGVFKDPTMKVIGIAASFVVGGSSIVFLLFKGKLLKSKQQFRVAWCFLGAEMVLLTLGAMHAFGSSLGWEFSPFVNEAAKLAVVLTFPLVMVEWLVVLSLDPDEANDRADNHSKSELAKTDRETRESLRMSDPVIKVRKAAAMTEVINDEMLRLPTAQRRMFAAILRNEYGDQFEGVQLFLNDGHTPDVIDQPRSTAAPRNAPIATPLPEQPADEPGWIARLAAKYAHQQPATQPQTMAAQGNPPSGVVYTGTIGSNVSHHAPSSRGAVSASRTHDDLPAEWSDTDKAAYNEELAKIRADALKAYPPAEDASAPKGQKA